MSCRSLPTYAYPCCIGRAATTVGNLSNFDRSSEATFVEGIPLTVTSLPFVNSASTRDCVWYVALKIAVDTAKETASATKAIARDKAARWRESDAATIRESLPTKGGSRSL